MNSISIVFPIRFSFIPSNSHCSHDLPIFPLIQPFTFPECCTQCLEHLMPSRAPVHYASLHHTFTSHQTTFLVIKSPSFYHIYHISLYGLTWSGNGIYKAASRLRRSFIPGGSGGARGGRHICCVPVLPGMVRTWWD